MFDKEGDMLVKHSEDGNLCFSKPNKGYYAFIVAKKPIKKGEELSFDFGEDIKKPWETVVDWGYPHMRLNHQILRMGTLTKDLKHFGHLTYAQSSSLLANLMELRFDKVPDIQLLDFKTGCALTTTGVPFTLKSDRRPVIIEDENGEEKGSVGDNSTVDSEEDGREATLNYLGLFDFEPGGTVKEEEEDTGVLLELLEI